MSFILRKFVPICIIFWIASEQVLVKAESNSWNCFEFINTIQPGTRELKYWKSSDWSDLINARAKVSNSTLESCKKALHKETLIIIVANESAVQRAFPPTPDLSGKTVWSPEIFQTYIIKNKGGNRTAYDCGHLFCKAKLGQDNKPIKLEAVNYKTGRFVDTINIKRCKQV